MSSGIWIATAGAVAQSQALDTTANNIANASTVGFHADRVAFHEALQAARSADTAAVDTGSSHVDLAPGAMHESDNPLDVALQGDGYFAVETQQGPRYTRAGNFQLDGSRTLVNADGHPVRGEGGRIVVPADTKHLAIGADGTVSADGTAIGKLEIKQFAPAQMQREGATLMAATGAPTKGGQPPTVHSGVLETSNVNVVRGVVDLVKISRNYESLMRVIQGYHDVESRAARELGGPK